MTKQLEDEKAKLIERKRQEQEERQRKQLELEKILEDNRRLVSGCFYFLLLQTKDRYNLFGCLDLKLLVRGMHTSDTH